MWMVDVSMQKESEITSGALVPAAVESNNCTNEIVGSLEPVSTAEVSKESSFVKGLLYNNEVDSVSITFNFDS